jgi:hypothetical protein
LLADARRYEHAFDETQDWGLTKFLDVSTLESPANGFLKDDSLLVAVYVQNVPAETSWPACTLRLRRTDLEEQPQARTFKIRRDCKLQVLMDQFAKLDSEVDGCVSYSSDLYKFTANGRPVNPISTADELELKDNDLICVRVNTWKLEKEHERSRRKEEKAAEEERKKRRKESAILSALKRKQGSLSVGGSKPKPTKAKSAKPEPETTDSTECREDLNDPKLTKSSDVVVVEVQDLSGSSTKFKIRRSQHLKKVSDWIESHGDCDSDSKGSVQHRYLLNGKEIDVNSTPDEIGLQESDVIHVAPLSSGKSMQDHDSDSASQSSTSVVDEDSVQARAEAKSQAKAAIDAQLERERRQRQQMQAEKQRLAREREEAAKVEEETRARANAEKREAVLQRQEAAAQRRREERQRKKEARERLAASRRAEKQRVAVGLQARARGAVERRNFGKQRHATIKIQTWWRQLARIAPRSAASSDSSASERGGTFESHSSPVSPLWSPAKPAAVPARPTGDSAWVSTTSSVQHLAAVPVEEFLSQLGLESLGPVLAENEVDVEALALMAPDDFDELGIDPSAQVRVHGKLAELRDTAAAHVGARNQATPQGNEAAALLRQFLRTDGMQCLQMPHAEILSIFADEAASLHCHGCVGAAGHESRMWGSR